MIKFLLKLYNLIFIILLPLVFLRLFLKSLKLKAYRSRWKERLGIFDISKLGLKLELQSELNLKNIIWIHAVSVGEIMAAVPIIQKLHGNLLITCTTPLGSYMVFKMISEKTLSNTATILHVYLPLDINFAVKNFFTRVKPKLLIILEKEIWPNLIINCYKHNIPIIIANAQMSNRSYRRYLIIKPLVSFLLEKIKFICVQTKFDAYKFKKILNYNNNLNNILITGNTKFDLAVQIKKLVTAEILTPTWIAASTHAGEEELILQAHKKILDLIPNALLILVPRHPERCVNIAKIIKNHTNNNLYNANKIKLIDSVGELNLFYGKSHVAFVGGSLVPIGGHNVLEPAAMSIPVVVGPYTASCKQIVSKMQAANGLFIIKNPEELSKIIIKLLINTALREQTGLNAKNFLYSQTGASNKIVDLIQHL